jgi:SAM-dependent methyltransferase
VAQRKFYDELRRRLPQSFQALAPGPPAPEHLIRTTAGMTESEVERWLNPDFYFRTGFEQMVEFIQALESVAFNIRTVGAVFELGCGSARLLRHLRCIQGIRLVGSDVNNDCVQWCRKHIAGIEFYQNELQPPVTFLEAASVDLIMASSVFTHIPIEWQRSWLEELHRVLRPGAIFLCTVLGRSYEKAMLTAEDRKKLQTNGHLVLNPWDDKASLATQYAGSCDVFQTRAEVVTVFGSVFQILDYVDRGAGGQDLLVLQKNRSGLRSNSPSR